VKKFCTILLMVFVAAAASWAQYDNVKKFELSLYGGFALTQVRGTTAYEDTWEDLILPYINEKTDITANSKNAAFFGAGLSYFFTPNFGVQLNVGYLKADVPPTADFNYNWQWNTGSTGSKTSTWTGTGSLSTIPISLNLVGKFGQDGFAGYISGGVTLFNNSFEATSSIGYGFTYLTVIWPYVYQNIDAIQVNMEVPKTSWMGFGGNIGAGVIIKLSDMFGLMIEARYFLCAKKDLDWNLITGNYNGLYTNYTNMTFSQDSANYIYDEGLLTKIQVNVSFFQITAGVKIFL